MFCWNCFQFGCYHPNYYCYCLLNANCRNFLMNSHLLCLSPLRLGLLSLTLLLSHSCCCLWRSHRFCLSARGVDPQATKFFHGDQLSTSSEHLFAQSIFSSELLTEWTAISCFRWLFQLPYVPDSFLSVLQLFEAKHLTFDEHSWFTMPDTHILLSNFSGQLLLTHESTLILSVFQVHLLFGSFHLALLPLSTEIVRSFCFSLLQMLFYHCQALLQALSSCSGEVQLCWPEIISCWSVLCFKVWDQ